MLKELLIKEVKEQLKLLIKNTTDKYLSLLDEEERVRVSSIIDKENYEIEDINDLLVDYFPSELTEEELFDLVKSVTFRKKFNKKELIIYIIESFLINIEKYQLKIISLIIPNLYTNDIELLSNYLENEDSNNEEVVSIIKRLSNVENEILNKFINNLATIFNGFEKNLINIDLIRSFCNEEIIEYKNYYLQYQEITNKLFKNLDNKEIVLLCLIFINDISIFSNIKLTKKDLISFIKKLEGNGFRLNNNQVNNLLNNFTLKYYQDNELNDHIKSLTTKVFTAYDEYYNNNFYFKSEDFINYYNDLYKDDFAPICFIDKYKPLNRNIFDSFFSIKGVNEIVVILEKELIKYKSFKPMIMDYKINCLESDKRYYERYKFYIENVDRVKDYFQYKNDVTIEYYILKNISSNDRSEFFELFRTYYGKEFKEIGRNGRSIKKCCLAIEKEYIEELNNTPFEQRYEVLNKYKEYCSQLKLLSVFNEQHLLEIMKEYENKYYNTLVSPKKKVKNKH